MRFLILTLAALVSAASAQTTTVTTALGITLIGNADGSATVTVGTGPAVTLPASAVTAVQALIGLANTVASGVTAGSNTVLSLPVTVDLGTGAVSVTFNGNTYTLDRTTFANLMALQGQIVQVIKGLRQPRTRPVVYGYRGHHQEGGRFGHHRG